MKKIHFCLYQQPQELNTVLITSLKSYIKNKKIDVSITYNIFKMHEENKLKKYLGKHITVNEIIYGLDVLEISDLDVMMEMLNNYHNNLDLLNNIYLNHSQLILIDQINKFCNKELNYDAICFSIFEAYFFFNLYTILLLKKTNLKIEIIVGGIQLSTSLLSCELLSGIKEIDYVINGDVETGIEDFLNEKIEKNIIYYPKNTDINLVHPIHYDLTDVKISSKIYINASRGCISVCNYCSSSNINFRTATINSIIKTIKFLNEKSIDIPIMFTDNIINFSNKRAHEFADSLISINNRLNITIYIIIKNTDINLIKKFKKANILNLSFGAEGFSESKNKNLNLGFKSLKEKTKEFIISCIKNNLILNPSTVVCCPNETIEDFNEDINFLKKIYSFQNKIKNIDFDIFPYQAYPNANYYKYPEKFNITFDYWKPMKLHKNIEHLNEIILKIPCHYYCDLSIKDYKRRENKSYKLVEKLNNKRFEQH